MKEYYAADFSQKTVNFSQSITKKAEMMKNTIPAF